MQSRKVSKSGDRKKLKSLKPKRLADHESNILKI